MKRMHSRIALLLTILSLLLELHASNKTYSQSYNACIEEEEEEEIMACNRYAYLYDTYENEPFYDEYNENAHPLEDD